MYFIRLCLKRKKKRSKMESRKRQRMGKEGRSKKGTVGSWDFFKRD